MSENRYRVATGATLTDGSRGVTRRSNEGSRMDASTLGERICTRKDSNKQPKTQ